jgi:hypothetical protein
MGSTARKLKRLAEQRRTFKLEADDAPTLIGRIRAVKLGQMLTATGAIDSQFRELFEGTLTAEQRRELTPSYKDDPEAFEEFMATGRRMGEAYLALGVMSLQDEEGNEIKLTFSNPDNPTEYDLPFVEDDAITVTELKEIYDENDIKHIENAIYKLSMGTARAGAEQVKSTTFLKANAAPPLRSQSLRN